MTRYLFALWLMLAPLPSLAAAPDDVDQLAEALRPISQMQGEFVQRQYGEAQELLVESTGHFRLLRPGYFSWEIVSPDKQLIIADPDYIWHHDRDLDTVTRRPLGVGSEMTPLQILGGDEDALRDGFTVQRLADDRFTLTPAAGDVGFRELTLDLAEGSLRGMEILDNLGQRVVITFTIVDTGSDISASDFVFTAPPGADLFYYDE